MKNNMRYFSMFSGIGGFEYGIERAALSIRDRETKDREPTTLEQGLEPATKGICNDRCISNPQFGGDTGSISCVGYSEIDKYAIKVYERHFGHDNRPDIRNRDTDLSENITNIKEQQNRTISNGHTNYGDATAIVPKLLPDFDLLVGGFPCQAFSIAGKRAGFDDTRGTLFFDIARILKEKQPRHLVLENVKGLLSHDQGRTFTTIIGVLTDLGYLVEWQVLNSKNFGVPQNRERVFIVGHLRGECGRKIFPLTKGSSWDIQSQGEPQKEGKRLRSDYSSTVNTRFGSTARGQQLVAATLAVRDYKGGNNLIAPNGKEIDLPKIRRLTPVECERLQGFPDNWTEKGIEYRTIVDYDIDTFPISVRMSDTQRYKMCGNAVTTNVVQAVIEGLLSDED